MEKQTEMAVECTRRNTMASIINTHTNIKLGVWFILKSLIINIIVINRSSSSTGRTGDECEDWACLSWVDCVREGCKMREEVSEWEDDKGDVDSDHIADVGW